MAEQGVIFSPSAARRVAAAVRTVEREPAGSGHRRHSVSVPRVGILFAVIVSNAAGTNGTKTTKANYTYTVTALTGEQLGTAVPLARPRPNGQVTTLSGSPAYGVAFYDGENLRLWDAGEIPSTGGC